MEIQWLEAKNSRFKDKEVRIAVNHGKTPHTQVVFYNGSANKVSDGDKISVGIAGHRMYFKKGGMFNLHQYPAKNAKYVRLPGLKEDFSGEFNLAFDAENKCWYVGY